MSRLSSPVICLCGVLFSAGAVYAQRGGSDWTTEGADAQRSYWMRGDAKISKETMQKPGFQFLWKVKFPNEPRGLNALTPAVLVNSYIGYRGFRSYAFLGGSSDALFALDSDLGKVEFTQRFNTGAPAAGATLACPGGLTAGPTRATQVAMVAAPAGRGGGGARAAGARSSVSDPGVGSTQLAAAEAAAAARGAQNAGRRGGGLGGRGRQNEVLLITGDGMLRDVYVGNGGDAQPPVKFLPAGANALGLIEVDSVVYAATSNGCGGAANGVWAIDLTTKEVTTWKSTGSVAGTIGASFAPDGTLYAATTHGELAWLEPKTLQQKGMYGTESGFTSSPVIFDYKDKVLVAAASKDNRIHVIEASKPMAAVAKSGVYSNAADFNTGALASWQDSDGTRWILAPAGGAVTGFSTTNGAVTNGAIAAWKVVDLNGAPSLQPGWVSRDMTSPLPPIVVNGVVFAISSGEFRGGGNLTAAQRAQRSGKAVLYALDAATGKELWNSGTTIASFVHNGGLSAAGGQMYLGTYDGTLYAFGIGIEH